MEVLMDMSEGLRAFANKYNRSITDPNLRRLYELDLSARRDEIAVIKTAERKGRAEGRVIERTETIRMLLNNGVSEEIIYKSIAAPRSEISAIIAKLRSGGGD